MAPILHRQPSPLLQWPAFTAVAPAACAESTGRLPIRLCLGVIRRRSDFLSLANTNMPPVNTSCAFCHNPVTYMLVLTSVVFGAHRVPSPCTGVLQRRVSCCWAATWTSWRAAAQQQPCSHQVRPTACCMSLASGYWKLMFGTGILLELLSVYTALSLSMLLPAAQRHESESA